MHIPWSPIECYWQELEVLTQHTGKSMCQTPEVWLHSYVLRSDWPFNRIMAEFGGGHIVVVDIRLHSLKDY